MVPAEQYHKKVSWKKPVHCTATIFPLAAPTATLKLTEQNKVGQKKQKKIKRVLNLQWL